MHTVCINSIFPSDFVRKTLRSNEVRQIQYLYTNFYLRTLQEKFRNIVAGRVQSLFSVRPSRADRLHFKSQWPLDIYMVAAKHHSNQVAIIVS